MTASVYTPPGREVKSQPKQTLEDAVAEIDRIPQLLYCAKFSRRAGDFRSAAQEESEARALAAKHGLDWRHFLPESYHAVRP